MTRGNFVLLTNDANWMSIQFNGDMYPSCNGKLVYYMLQNQVTDYDSLAAAIRRFDDACFGYAREYGEDVSPRKAPDEIDFSHDYFKIYNSDYLYIKNTADFPITITDNRRQEHKIQPDEIQVWYFGQLEETDHDDLVLDKEDKKTLGISYDKEFSDKVKTIFADCDDVIKNPPANMTPEENVIMAAIITLRAVLEGKV